MNCFEHLQKAAVGTCTHCGRGLCRECATTAEGKLSCRGICEQEIVRERRLLEKSEQAVHDRNVIYDTSANVYHRQSAMISFLGVMFLLCGVFLLIAEYFIFGAIVLILSMVFALSAVSFRRAAKKFKSLN